MLQFIYVLLDFPLFGKLQLTVSRASKYSVQKTGRGRWKVAATFCWHRYLRELEVEIAPIERGV